MICIEKAIILKIVTLSKFKISESFPMWEFKIQTHVRHYGRERIANKRIHVEVYLLHDLYKDDDA